MRLLILENCVATTALLNAGCGTVGFAATVAHTQEDAQHALAERDFFAAILADHLLGARPFNLADYIRLTRPTMRLALLQGPMRIEQTWESDIDLIAPRPTGSVDVIKILAALGVQGRLPPPPSELVFAKRSKSQRKKMN